MARAGLGAHAEQSREDGGLEQHAPMVVDVVLESGLALCVSAGLALQHDRVAIGHDDAGLLLDRDAMRVFGILRTERAATAQLGREVVGC